MFYALILSENRVVQALSVILANLLVVGLTIILVLALAALVEGSFPHIGVPGFLSLWLGGIIIASLFLIAAFRG